MTDLSIARDLVAPAQLPARLSICVTFHFALHRLVYLETIASEFAHLGKRVEVCIITNTHAEDERAKIRATLINKGFDFRMMSPTLLGHPFLLTWCHLDIFRDRIASESSITHFMYVEDDICVRPENVVFWMDAREKLRPYHLIPSFIRYEYRSGSPVQYATDVTHRYDPLTLPRIDHSADYAFFNMPQPYQGLYFLDRELMHEHLSGMSSSPEFSMWNIRETATRGLTFANVPRGCRSRNFIGYRIDEGRIDPDCMLHHTPNNYANMSNTRMGKIPMAEIISPRYAPSPAVSAPNGMPRALTEGAEKVLPEGVQ